MNLCDYTEMDEVQDMAWHRGYHAFSEKGVFREHNPFTAGTRRNEQWLDGFNTAFGSRYIPGCLTNPVKGAAS